MTTSQRDFLTAAPTTTGSQANSSSHEYSALPSDSALRVMSLESLRVEKGLVDAAALNALVDADAHEIGPQNGARVLARVWTAQ